MKIICQLCRTLYNPSVDRKCPSCQGRKRAHLTTSLHRRGYDSYVDGFRWTYTSGEWGGGGK